MQNYKKSMQHGITLEQIYTTDIELHLLQSWASLSLVYKEIQDN